ncbi:MAG: hypothetical protein ACSLEN_04115 [Candidatus Malihini olakiniferum]
MHSSLAVLGLNFVLTAL